jgi:hypothetical protein
VFDYLFMSPVSVVFLSGLQVTLMAWVLWTGTVLPGYSGQPPTVAAVAPFNTTAIVAQGTMFAIVIQVGCSSPMYPMRCVQTPGG